MTVEAFGKIFDNILLKRDATSGAKVITSH